MTNLKMVQINKSYGNVPVIRDVNLQIATGEFVVFVGPSGCGKSTLLRLIAGLEDITSGELSVDGKIINTVPPAKRGIAMVFQSYALFPHLSVFENMAFGLRLSKASKVDIDRQVRRAASMLQLEPYLDRLPKELSGGQRQRVAIGRAIVRNPKIFLFDEPLSNLDAALRVATRIEIARLKESLPDTTMIYVTHDQVEAMTLADRIVVLRDGRVEQVGSPLELYHHPANEFVAQFIGSPAMNLFAGTMTVVDGKASVLVDGGTLIAVKSVTGGGDMAVKIGLRPEDVEIVPADQALIWGTVNLLEKLGEVTLAYLNGDAGQMLIAKLDGDSSVSVGDRLPLGTGKSRLHVFDATGAAMPESDRP